MATEATMLNVITSSFTVELQATQHPENPERRLPAFYENFWGKEPQGPKDRKESTRTKETAGAGTRTGTGAAVAREQWKLRVSICRKIYYIH